MTWGGEVKLRAKLEDALEEYYTVPCVAIVLGGGVGTFDNVYEMLQRDNPVLVVKESRGCAMAVAEFYEAHCAAVQKLEGRQTLRRRAQGDGVEDRDSGAEDDVVGEGAPLNSGAILRNVSAIL